MVAGIEFFGTCMAAHRPKHEPARKCLNCAANSSASGGIFGAWKMHKRARDIMLKSLRSKPVAIALASIFMGTTAALAAIKIAPKPTTDSVTVYSEIPQGQVILSHQDGTIAFNRNCKRFPCQLDISSLSKGEYDVMIRNGTDIQQMVALYKE
jgi:hypothetical protein